MKENQNESKSRGFYIALSICLVAVFISAFFAYSNINKIMVSNKEETERINSSAIESSSNKHEKKDTNKQKPETSEKKSPNSEKIKQTSAKEDKNNNIIFPSGEEIINQSTLKL